MTLEAVIAFVVAAAALWLVLQPLLRPAASRALPAEPLEP
jgi:hypothetical protein